MGTGCYTIEDDVLTICYDDGTVRPSLEHSKADGKNELFRRIKEPQIS